MSLSLRHLCNAVSAKLPRWVYIILFAREALVLGQGVSNFGPDGGSPVWGLVGVIVGCLVMASAVTGFRRGDGSRAVRLSLAQREP